MVIVRLSGGLGNQLFQYALGRVLSLHHGVPLKMDITLYETYKLHFYSLAPFHTVQETATSEEVRKAKLTTYSTLEARVKKITEILKPYYKKSYLKEQSFAFDPNVLKASGNVYLDGYWQSEKYFKSFENKLREEFTIIPKQSGWDKKITNQIQKTNSVSLHVRRADYITNPVTYAFHGVCTLEYYDKAIIYLAKKIKDMHIFIFSDDKKWARKALHFSYPATFVHHNGPDKNYEDLRLMSRCKHHIIANSTFSWWGAWLDNKPGKMVIAPNQWFANSKLNTSDLYPKDWIKM